MGNDRGGARAKKKRDTTRKLARLADERLKAAEPKPKAKST